MARGLAVEMIDPPSTGSAYPEKELRVQDCPNRRPQSSSNAFISPFVSNIQHEPINIQPHAEPNMLLPILSSSITNISISTVPSVSNLAPSNTNIHLPVSIINKNICNLTSPEECYQSIQASSLYTMSSSSSSNSRSTSSSTSS